MKSKGFELAISTIVLLALGLVLLLGLVYILTDGFSRFKSSTGGFIATSEVTATKEACEIACRSQDKLTYCCRSFTIEGKKISCGDSRLGVSCSLSCDGFVCE